jgi:hypothetical protein
MRLRFVADVLDERIGLDAPAKNVIAENPTFQAAARIAGILFFP